MVGEEFAAPVAQLDRAVAFEATGRGFESLRARKGERTLLSSRRASEGQIAPSAWGAAGFYSAHLDASIGHAG